MKTRLAAIALLAFAAAPLQAQSRTCSNSVGALPANAFTGSGIPTDNSQIATCVFETPAAEVVGLTLGLRAHQRGSNSPAVTYAGAGTYLATAGLDASIAPPAQANYATWNFGFYVSGANASQYTYRLFYDFDGAAGTQTVDLGSVLFAGANADSWNLGMGFLSTSVPSIILPPAATFNPNSGGEYTFRLSAYDPNARAAFASTSMTVVSRVPEPTTVVLMMSGLAGLAVASRRVVAATRD